MLDPKDQRAEHPEEADDDRDERGRCDEQGKEEKDRADHTARPLAKPIRRWIPGGLMDSVDRAGQPDRVSAVEEASCWTSEHGKVSGNCQTMQLSLDY